MAFGTTNIDLVAAAASVTSAQQLVAATLDGDTNKWSFYKAGRTRANATTKEIELFDDGGDHRLYDFALYDNTAQTPECIYGGNINYSTGVSTVVFESVVRLHELNVKELEYADTENYSAIIVDAYSSSSNRASETSRIYRWVFDISYTTITPQANTFNDIINVTKKPNSPQTVSLTGISTSYGTLYLKTSLGEKTGTNTGVIGVELPSPNSTLTLTEITGPILTGGTVVGEAGDYRILHRVSVPSTACQANEITDLTAGSGKSFTSYVTPYYVTDNKYLTTSGTVEITWWKNGVEQAVLYTGSLTSTSKYVTASGITLANGDYLEVRVELISGSWTFNNC